MKKFAFFFPIAAMMFAVGCAKENNTDVVENNNDELVSYSFTVASLEEDAVRSDLTNAGAFSWEVGDYIAIYNSASSEYVSFEVTEVLSNGDAIISALATSGAVWTNAIYPAERAAGAGNQVNYTVSSVAGPILVSNVDSQELSFMYLGSVANIEVTGVPGTPTTLTFTANANVFGTRSFSWDEYGKPVLGGSGSVDSITVPFNSAGVTTVPIPKADYAGFTITVDNAAGRHLYKKTTTKNFTLATSNAILLPMSAIAYSDPVYFLKVVQKTNGTTFWTSNALYPMVKIGTNTYFAAENVDRMSTYYIYDEWNDDPILTGSTTADSYTANTFSFVGEGDLLGNWTTNNNSSCAFNKIGNWNYLFNKNLYQKRFVIRPWDDKGWDIWRPNNNGGDAWFTSSVKSLSATKVENNAAFYSNLNEALDFYFNSSSGYEEVKVYSTGDKSNPLCALGKFTYNSSSNTVSSLDVASSAVNNAPFGDASFPTGQLALSGTFNSWGDGDVFTYVGNQSWELKGLSITTAGEYRFKIRKVGGWDYEIDAKDEFGDTLYGKLRSRHEDLGYKNEASVNLSVGTYDVYLNATADWYYNIMLVKR